MAHEMFIMDMNYATMLWKQHGDINKIVTFVRKVPEWLIMHVNTVDAPTAEFLARRIGEE
jgi:hemerythrin